MPNFEAQQWSTEDAESVPSPKKKKRFNFVRLLIFLTLIAIIGFSADIIIKEYTAKTFPDLPAGSYWGKVVQGISDVGPGTTIFLERADDRDLMHLSFIKGETSRKVEVSLDYSTLQNDGAFSAITVSLEGKIIKLSGQRGENNDFEGTIVDASTGEVGNWFINSIFLKDISAEQADELNSLLALSAENHLIHEQLEALESELEKSRADAVMITSYAAGEAEGSALVNEEIKRIEEKILSTKNEIKDSEKLAKELRNSVDLSKKISPRGRLVALTRETLERDRRWASSLERNAQTSESYLRQQYTEALEIKRLLAQIAELEAQLWDELPQSEGFSSPEVKNDDVYWLNYE